MGQIPPDLTERQIDRSIQRWWPCRAPARGVPDRTILQRRGRIYVRVRETGNAPSYAVRSGPADPSRATRRPRCLLLHENSGALLRNSRPLTGYDPSSAPVHPWTCVLPAIRGSPMILQVIAPHRSCVTRAVINSRRADSVQTVTSIGQVLPSSLPPDRRTDGK